ncbi:MAG: ferritin-like domain-containing protein [Planctomycetia bacterium]|nr:ferritin-like domain-containing protein [Planctomycetia bacterium]
MIELGQHAVTPTGTLAAPPPPTRSTSLRSSAEWCDYFHANSQRLLPIPWEDGVPLTATEREIVAHSMQTFQLGESGEGRHIRRAADRYAARSGDVEYPAALRLFIGEEHRHAALLGRILDGAGIPRIRKQWSDGIFRKLRHQGGLELAICVLLTAELIAKIYYAALRAATRSSVIRRACEQILRDEAMHIQFQSERLALLRRSRRRWRRWTAVTLQRLFFYGTCTVFWMSHRRMLAAGGFPLRRVIRRARLEFRHVITIV